MNDPKCHHCATLKSAHVDLHCPDGSGRTFKNPVRVNHASQSFTAAEVELLAAVMTGLPKHADLRLLARRPEMASVARKVTGMRESIKRRKAGR